jgi:hypothetical protein
MEVKARVAKRAISGTVQGQQVLPTIVAASPNQLDWQNSDTS